MHHVYFDESIHSRGGFILGAYVFGEDAGPAVTEVLRQCGLRPDIDEFKSSARMVEHPEQVAVRRELVAVLDGYRIGVAVVPSEERASLGLHALRALAQMTVANGPPATRWHAHFDRGVFASAQLATESALTLGLDRYYDVSAEEDSRVVKGIQLADLVAHTCATMLLETLGIVTKRVKVGPDSGCAADVETELGFELWAGIRYRFLHGGPVNGQDPIYTGALMDVGAQGLYVADSCSPALREGAVRRFGENYLGCIH
jgi:hypothetical protein